MDGRARRMVTGRARSEAGCSGDCRVREGYWDGGPRLRANTLRLATLLRSPLGVLGHFVKLRGQGLQLG